MRFGCLFVYDEHFEKASKAGYVDAFCDCGTVKRVKKCDFNRIKSCNSCGIYQKSCKTTINGNLHKTAIYNSWDAMKQRCSNQKSQNYHHYGGRGIGYDFKWETFDGFCEDMLGSYSEGLTLDRIDVNGNYCKENCRWVTRSVQSFNRRITNKNTSGTVGVSWCKVTEKWYSYIDHLGVRVDLGRYENLDEAINVRKSAEMKYFGEFSNKSLEEK